MDNNKNIFLKHTMTWGAMLGLSLILVSFLIWATDALLKNFMFSFIVILINLALTITFVVLAVKKYRNEHLASYISYKQAFVTSLLIIVFSSFFTVFFELILNYVIDPLYFQNTLEASKEGMAEFLYNFNVPEGQIEEAIGKFDEQTKPAINDMVFGGLMRGIIVGSVLSLILAAILKREKPLFSSNTTEISEQDRME